MHMMQISCRSRKDWGLVGEKRDGEQDERNRREGKYMHNRCVIKGKSLSSTLEGWFLTGDLGQLSDLLEPNDIQVKATLTWCVRWGGGRGEGGWWAVPDGQHQPEASLIRRRGGPQVTAGSPQLEMNSCSLMRSRDERVANYSALLCAGNNLLLWELSVINLLYLLLYLFFMFRDLTGLQLVLVIF